MRQKRYIYLLITLVVMFIINILAVKPLNETPFMASGPYKRSEVDDRYKWNLNDIYGSSDEWNKELLDLKKHYNKIVKFKGKLHNAENIAQCFALRETLLRRTEKIYLYARMQVDENQANSLATEAFSKANALIAELFSSIAFIQPEILQQPAEQIKGYASNPLLVDYKFYFEKLLKEKKHMLSEKEERLLGMTTQLAGAPRTIYDKLTLADIKYPDVVNAKGEKMTLTAVNYEQYLRSKDRELRIKAFEGILGTYDRYKHTFQGVLNSQVNNDIFYARARNYDSALVASLSSENIPKEVYLNLIKTVNKRLDVLHRYVTLRKNALKLDKVYEYDMYVPLTDDYFKKIDYKEAQKILIQGLKPLGDDYERQMKTAFNSRWIDVYETGNKYSGNYSWGAYDTHPYILLNYNDNFTSVLTLSHEMGHALHSYYSNKTQKYSNAETSIFTSEVAAAVNELLVMDYLNASAKNTQEELFLIEKQIENIKGSLFTQVMFAEFELAIHEKAEKGEALSVEILNDMWESLLQKYHGKDFALHEFSGIGWARIPHFYMNYYVFKYATSIGAANQIVKNMGNNDEVVDRYHALLKAGSSDYPINLLKGAGVDMTTTEPIENVLDDFDQLVVAMEQMLKKTGKIK